MWTSIVFRQQPFCEINIILCYADQDPILHILPEGHDLEEADSEVLDSEIHDCCLNQKDPIQESSIQNGMIPRGISGHYE